MVRQADLDRIRRRLDTLPMVQGAGNTNCMSLAYTGALEVSLKYDPAGRLYEVSGGIAGIQRFAYDGNAMISEYNASGAMLRRYVHGSNVGAALRQAQGDRPLIVYEGAAVADATRRYLHADPRGSIVAVTNWQGTAIATNSYDEFGIPDNAAGADIASKGRFRYTGQAWLGELGMYYYKARIYSPTTTVPDNINEIILNIGLGKRAPPPPQSALLGVINQPGNGRPRARASSASPQSGKNDPPPCNAFQRGMQKVGKFGVQLGGEVGTSGLVITGGGLAVVGGSAALLQPEGVVAGGLVAEGGADVTAGGGAIGTVGALFMLGGGSGKAAVSDLASRVVSGSLPKGFGGDVVGNLVGRAVDAIPFEFGICK